MEINHVYPVETEVADLDANGILKPHAYQKLFARIAEEHLNLLGLNVETTLRHQLAWALVTLSFEVVRPVAGCVRLFATTWHSQRKGPYFRRELVFRNEADEIVFQGSTFSVLLDVQTRSVYRKKVFPFPIGEPYEVFTIDASPTLRIETEPPVLEHRQVRNSHIDALGHVNNTRYGEFAHDALTQEECGRLGKLRRLDLQFSSELRPGDVFTVGKETVDNRIVIRGRNEAQAGVSFDCVFTFS